MDFGDDADENDCTYRVGQGRVGTAPAVVNLHGTSVPQRRSVY